MYKRPRMKIPPAVMSCCGKMYSSRDNTCHYTTSGYSCDESLLEKHHYTKQHGEIKGFQGSLQHYRRRIGAHLAHHTHPVE